MQTEEEKIRYDRQVRLWGASTQQQISATSLTTVVPPELHASTAAGPSSSIAPSGFVGEVSKNLVLAGIKGIHVQPYSAKGEELARFGLSFSNALTIADVECNFYARGLAASRHESMLAMMKDLNPFVATSAGDGEGAVLKEGGNTVVVEQLNVAEVAAFVAAGDTTNAAKEVTAEDTADAASSSNVASYWACVTLGPNVLVCEQTMQASKGPTDARRNMRTQLAALVDPSRCRCAALPTPGRVIVLTVGVVAAVLRAYGAAATKAVDGSELLLLASSLAEAWGVAMTDDVADLISSAAGYAAAVLHALGYTIECAEMIPSVPSPAPSVIDASVAGGLIAQRVINAISTPLTNNCSVNNVYALCASGASVEAFVAPYPALA